jgi:hypothetical protein
MPARSLPVCDRRVSLSRALAMAAVALREDELKAEEPQTTLPGYFGVDGRPYHRPMGIVPNAPIQQRTPARPG